MIKSELITYFNPKSPVSEIFKNLRTNIQFMNSNEELKSLLITSTMPGAGKTWVSANLAIAFAQTGKRVILIDGDMRKSRIYKIFNVLQKPGLSNFLSGITDDEKKNYNVANYIRETQIPNLYVMTAGNVPPNPSELLAKTKMEYLLDTLKNECDLIIIDGTPSRLVTDAIVLSRIVDSTIIVTSHNETRKDDLLEIKKNIENVGGKIAGVVYNKLPVKAKEYKEGYYYGANGDKKKTEEE